MDLIATAKCGLLDRVFEGTFWLPLMPTVLAASAFVLAHGLGRIMAHVSSIRALEFHSAWPRVRFSIAALGVALAVMVAARGIAYPLFLLRMTKDAYYCSYFEAGRDLQLAHVSIFALMFATQTIRVMVFDEGRFRQLQSRSLRILSTGLYVGLGATGYLMAVALDAILVPLTLLFMLPFAFCGIGVLARLR